MQISKPVLYSLWLTADLCLGASAAFAAEGEPTTLLAQEPTSAAPEPAITPSAPINPPSARDASTRNPDSGLPQSYNASAVHYYGFRGEVDPFTVFTLGLTWKLDDYSITLAQELTKLYFVHNDESEIQFADTVARISRPVSEAILGFQPKVYFRFTLPVSEFSREQGVTTKTRLGTTLSRAYLAEALTWGFDAYGQYNWNRKTTTKTTYGAGGGRPLRQAAFRLETSLSYKLTQKISTDGSIGYSRVKYEEVGFKNRQTTASTDALLNTDYDIGLGLSYEVSKNLSLSGGYSQSDTVEKTGGVREAYVFDQYTTQWYIGASSSF